VTFTQVTAEARRHRDAIRFSNGNCVLLQDLKPGQLVHVLRLSSDEDCDRSVPLETLVG